ncbi:MAG: hypothetical protein PVF62_05215, partial [Desulfobacterales bacterium]
RAQSAGVRLNWPTAKRDLLFLRNEPLNQIIPLIRDCLDKQSSAHDEIAGPFSFARITRDGFEALSN